MHWAWIPADAGWNQLAAKGSALHGQPLRMGDASAVDIADKPPPANQTYGPQRGECPAPIDGLMRQRGCMKV